MAHKKQGGKLVQRVRPRPKYLGVKVSDGEEIGEGQVLVRQRGTKLGAGVGVAVARDHTLFSLKKGIVRFKEKWGKKMVTVVS